MKWTVAVALIFAFSTSVSAQIFTGSGAVVITQSNAVAGGITPGDTPGFPVTISLPGSYKLGTNLSPPSGIDAIVITADNVSIDLMGFTIAGYLKCTHTSTTSCPSGSFGVGIVSQGSNVSIKGGTISGFSIGISLQKDISRISDVTLTSNAAATDTFMSSGNFYQNIIASTNGSGIDASGQASVLSNVITVFNGGYGMYVNGAIVTDSISQYNNGSGVVTIGSSTMNKVTSNFNGQHGITFGGDTIVRDSIALTNQSNGFNVQAGQKAIFENSFAGGNVIGFNLNTLSCYSKIGGRLNGTNLVSGTALAGTTATCF